MDSLSTILNNKDYNEPDSIQKLKTYIESAYNSTPKIRTGPKGITIIVSSGALANTLRLDLPKVKKELNIKERLSIIIG